MTNEYIEELTGISIKEIEDRFSQENELKKRTLQDIVSLFDNLCELVVYQKTNLSLFQKINKALNDLPENEKTKLVDLLNKYKNQVDLPAFKIWSTTEILLDRIRLDKSIFDNETDLIFDEVLRAKQYKQMIKQQIRNIS